MQSAYTPSTVPWKPPAPGTVPPATPALGNYGNVTPATDPGSPTTYKPPAAPGWHGTPPMATTPDTAWTPQSSPGVGEDWWTKYGDQFTQPGPQQNYWNGVNGFFTGGPTTSETNLHGYAGQLGAPGSTESLYNQFNNSGAFTTPGSYEQWYAQHQGDMGRPGAGESTMAGLLGTMQNQGAGENYFDQTQGFYKQPGVMEGLYGQHGQDLIGVPGAIQSREGGIQGNIDQAKNLQQFFGKTQGDLTSMGYAEQLAHQGLSDAPSFQEQFLTGGGATQGLDALYARLGSQQARALDERAAAGGSFNSGAALRNREELGADLTAQHVKDFQAASTGADAGRMARLNYGLGVNTAADAGLRGRIGLGFQGAQGVDTTALARADAMQTLAKSLSDEKRQNFDSTFGAAQGTQASALSRVMGGQSSANAAGDQRLARLLGASTTANNMDLLGQNRFKLGGAAADASQADFFARIKSGMDAGSMSDTQKLARLTGAGNLDTSAQNLELQRLLGGGTLSSNAGDERLRGLLGGSAGSLGAQGAKETRQNNVFTNTLGLGGAQASAFAGGADKMNNEQFAAKMTEIQGMLQRGQISADEAKQMMQMYMQMMSMPLSVLPTK